MGKSRLVIVESPTKAKTIRKFLPKDFVVEASMGHVRDLPQSASDIPAALKDQEWTRIGVNIENDFEPLYVVPKNKSKVISDLKKKIKDATEVYLATDEDREGESISWHLMELLKPKVPVKRMVFHEITKAAIQKALTETRDLDLRLVRAQETRRILDRLVGYTLSPLIWKKIAYGLSAGRVQSVALRLIVDRERERLAFQKAEYWDLEAKLAKDRQDFTAKIISVAGKKVATGKDFDENTGKPAAGKDVLILDKNAAEALKSRLEKAQWTVQSQDEKKTTSRPAPPFITSTLQQESNRKLGLSAKDTMRVAQSLYEEGLITYMRTDSPSLSQEAMNAARSLITELYGNEFLPDTPRIYTSKSKSAQEAHEAIRPAGTTFMHPRETGLSGRELAVYELIWKRTVASQMSDAQKLSVSVKITAEDALFNATGSRILFPGYLRAYVEGSDDPDAVLADREVLLPVLKQGDALSAKELQALPHETKPPARFTEASLVQALEKAAIGRPSTYASIIGTIVDRGYVRKQGNALIPTFTGMAVIQLLEKHFQELVDLGFTSTMENSLDEIAEGSLDWLPYLKKFYLGKTGLLKQVEEQEKKIKPEVSRTIELTLLQKEGIQIKIGRYGAYLVKEGGDKSTDEVHCSVPEDVAPADLTVEAADELLEASKNGPEPLGNHPKTGEPIYCLVGRYGPYVQLGEATDENPKPKRASIPKGKTPKDLTIDEAVHLLALPRELGIHPETGKPIIANQGRFGPYIMHEGDFRSLKKEDDVYTVPLKRALEILSEEKKPRAGSKVIKELGDHPEDKKPVTIYTSRFGPYIKHASTMVSLPKGTDAEAMTLEQGLELIVSKREGGGAKKTKKKPASKKTKKKA